MEHLGEKWRGWMVAGIDRRTRRRGGYEKKQAHCRNSRSSGILTCPPPRAPNNRRRHNHHANLADDQLHTVPLPRKMGTYGVHRLPVACALSPDVGAQNFVMHSYNRWVGRRLSQSSARICRGHAYHQLLPVDIHGRADI